MVLDRGRDVGGLDAREVEVFEMREVRECIRAVAALAADWVALEIDEREVLELSQV